MGVGNHTLKAVFDVVVKHGSVSRREIAELLGISHVSVCEAVEVLVKNDFLKVGRDKYRRKGRPTAEISVNKSLHILLIDASGKDIYYSIPSLGDASASPEIISHLYDLDAESNLVAAICEIKQALIRKNIKPFYTFLAVPGEISEGDGKIVKSYCRELEGISIARLMSDRGLAPDLALSASAAADQFCRDITSENFIYISVDNGVWGSVSSEMGRFFVWNGVKVSTDHVLPYSEILKCGCDGERYRVYTERLIGTLRTAFNTDKVFLSARGLPGNAREMLGEDPGTANVTAEEPILTGMLKIAEKKIFEKIIR